TYRAEIDTRSIDPKKKDLFINLFSIYTGIPQSEIRDKFLNSRGKSVRGRVVLLKNIDVRLASDLKALGSKLNRLKIFKPINMKKPHIVLGLDILADNEGRFYPYERLLTPIVGYVQIKEVDGYKRPVAKKGLEKRYDYYLKASRDGLIEGRRDLIGTVILDGTSRSISRIDGMNLHLNIPLEFQHAVESVIDSQMRKLDAEEILVAVMDSKSGKILAMATSDRFNPSRIRKRDMGALNPDFTEYLYEPGSVIKPLTLAIALEHKKVNMHREIPLGGKYRVNDSYTITDDSYFKSLTPRGIIMHSSNIGISKIAWRLSGRELHDGLRGFGLAQKSGVDLSKELAGNIRAPYMLDDKTYSANSSYGYGMSVNFMQILKAYSAFNNGGVAVTPKIADFISDRFGKRVEIKFDVPPINSCSAKVAKVIHSILIDVVKDGTAKLARYHGLEIGGKTGTAHVAENGRYIDKYHSSFFGFANDADGHRYTIGVLVIKPSRYYFASQTAVPTFRRVVDKMVNFNLLRPKVGSREQ
ncbi:MAG: penicillin-binding protein 2, partial [Epsilonproteobacteria bacterium]|nr:penicillin-binding protein 2 [Campylobacterota bacterium]